MNLKFFALPLFYVIVGCGTAEKAKTEATSAQDNSVDLIGASSFQDDSSNDEASKGRLFGVRFDGKNGDFCSSGKIGPRHLVSAGHCNSKGSHLTKVLVEAGTGPIEPDKKFNLEAESENAVYANSYSGRLGTGDLMALAIKPGAAYANISKFKDLNITTSKIGAYSEGKIRVTGYGCTTNVKDGDRTFSKTAEGGTGVFFDFRKRSKEVGSHLNLGSIFSLGMPANTQILNGVKSILSTVPKGKLLENRVELCAGDSGGPVLQNNVIVGVNSGTYVDSIDEKDPAYPDFKYTAYNVHAPMNIPMVQDVLNTPIIDGFDTAELAKNGKPQAYTAIDISETAPLKVVPGKLLVLVGYKLAGVQIRFPGVATPLAVSQSYTSAAENQLGIERVVVQVPQGVTSGPLEAFRSGQLNQELFYTSARSISLASLSLTDFAYQQSDSAALSDLNSTVGDLPVVEVEAGKSLYLLGNGLKGASFSVPGSSARLAGSVVNIPSGDPLSKSGKDVVKIVIPAGAVAGSVGSIVAQISTMPATLSVRKVKIIENLEVWSVWTSTKFGGPQSLQGLSYSCPISDGGGTLFLTTRKERLGGVVTEYGPASQDPVNLYLTNPSRCLNFERPSSSATVTEFSHTESTGADSPSDINRLYVDWGSVSTNGSNFRQHFTTEITSQSYITMKKLSSNSTQCERVVHREYCFSNFVASQGVFNKIGSCGTDAGYVAPVDQKTTVPCSAQPSESDRDAVTNMHPFTEFYQIYPITITAPTLLN